MILRPTHEPPCRLGPGDLRRVSQDRRLGLVGYHVCCPRCGFVTFAWSGRDGLAITEDEERVSFSRPLRCLHCAVLIGLRDGEADLQEDDGVRNVPPR